MSVAVPRAAGVLRGAVPGEGRHSDGAGHQGAPQVLAKDLLAEGGQYSENMFRPNTEESGIKFVKFECST